MARFARAALQRYPARDFRPMSGLTMWMPSPLRPLALFVVATALTFAATAATPAHALVVGIADNKPDMFGDPRFTSAGIGTARLSVSWDALTSPWQTHQLDVWLEEARAARVEPLISFGHSTRDRRSLPTPERFLFEFRRFRARYPWVTTFATWNEANHCGEPLCHRPKLAAAFYRVLRRECPTCTVLAPEVLDTPNMRSWVQAFARELGFMPQLWGLHNYVEANRFKMHRLRELLRITRGARVWLTETGGLV